MNTNRQFTKHLTTLTDAELDNKSILDHYNKNYDGHGKNGHFNILELDHDSVVTGKGKHDRVAAHIPSCDEYYEVRVDHVWGLGMPTPKDVLAVARRDQGVRGKWEFINQETFMNSKFSSTAFTFKRA